MSGLPLREIMRGVSVYPAAPRPRLVALSTAAYWQSRSTYVIRLHHTDILTFYGVMQDSPDKNGRLRFNQYASVDVNAGSWFTPTTKARINTFLPGFKLGSVTGEWAIGPGHTLWWSDAQPFTGQITIVDGQLPACPDNPIRRRLTETAITRLVKYAESKDFKPPMATVPSCDLTRGIMNGELHPDHREYLARELITTWWRYREPISGIVIEATSAVIGAATRTVFPKLAAHKLGSAANTKPILRRAIRQYLRNLLLPTTAEDLREIDQ